MTRADFEALIWRNARALTEGTPEARVAAMDRVLAAADAYTAATLGEIDSYRRKGVRAADPVHYQHPDRPPGAAACHGRVTHAKVTTIAARADCRGCARTTAYLEALAGGTEAVAS